MISLDLIFVAQSSVDADWPMVVLKLLFLPLTPFVMHPGRAGCVALTFLAAGVLVYAGKKRISGWLVAAAVTWALYAWWEHYCTLQKHDIRVDLFLIAPVLLSITLGGAWGLIEPWMRRPTIANSDSAPESATHP